MYSIDFSGVNNHIICAHQSVKTLSKICNSVSDDVNNTYFLIAYVNANPWRLNVIKYNEGHLNIY